MSAEILFIPLHILHPVNFTPERLEKMYRYKVAIPQFDHSSTAERLKVALKQTSAEPMTLTSDLRWKLSVTQSDNTTITLYMDGFGKLGQVQKTPVLFQGKLYSWLRELTKGIE